MMWELRNAAHQTGFQMREGEIRFSAEVHKESENFIKTRSKKNTKKFHTTLFYKITLFTVPWSV